MFLTKARILSGNSNRTFTYSLTLSANGGSNAYVTSLSSANAQDSWSGSAGTASVLVRPDDVVSVVTSAPTRSGYIFQGWSNSSSGSVVFSSTSFNISVASLTADVARTLYAKWVTAATYTLNFNANGGSGAPPSQSVTTAATPLGYTFTIPSTTPTLSGHTFAGWATSSTGSAVYQPGGTITVTSTTTLYAAWTPDYKSQTLSGSGTFTVPSHVRKLRVTIKGGGGGGGGGLYVKRVPGGASSTGEYTEYSSLSGGTGGTGGYRQETITTTPSSTFSYSVGSGGGGGAKSTPTVSSATTVTGTTGSAGGTSTFGSYSSTGGGGGGAATLTTQSKTWRDYSYWGVKSSSNGSTGTAGSPSGSGGAGGAGGSGNAAGSSGGAGSIVVECGSGIQ